MENRLEHLNQVNDVPVHSVLDPEFASYGRVVTGYDFSEMIAYMEQNTPIPENGNVYVASVPEMEALAVSAEVQKKFYGDMPVEVGYCNGRNTTWNGFEYHKGSERIAAGRILQQFVSRYSVMLDKQKNSHAEKADNGDNPRGPQETVHNFLTVLHTDAPPCSKS